MTLQELIAQLTELSKEYSNNEIVLWDAYCGRYDTIAHIVISEFSKDYNPVRLDFVYAHDLTNKPY